MMNKVFYSVFFVVFAVFAIYIGLVWLRSGTISPSLDFKIPEEVLIGVPFELEAGISNDSGQVLKDASVSLSLPDGVVFIGQPPEEKLAFKKLGNLGTGSLTGEVFHLMAIQGDAGTTKQIKAVVSYTPESIDSVFNKESKVNLKIGGPAINVEVIAPDKANSGAQTEIKISYENISGGDLNSLFLEAEYPAAFRYEKSTLNPDKGDNYWSLGGLRGGSANTISIIGKLIGQAGTAHIFKIKLGSLLEEKPYVINEQISSIAIKAIPVSLNITANNVSEYIATPGDLIEYKIHYSYLDGASGKPALLTAKLSGEMFENPTPLKWSVSGDDKAGEVVFKARVRGDYPIRRLGDRNFTLKVEVQLEDGGNVVVAELENKVVGRIAVEAAGLFRDAAGGILNQGPFSPKAGEPTEYTIHWLVTNYSNDARNVAVRAKLPDYVKFTGVTKSDGGSQPAYNSSSNEVVWEINRISATKGIASDPLEAVFQVSAVPPPSSAGEYLVLVNKTSISATDEFTGFPLSAEAPAVTTRLEADKTVQEGEGRVR